MMSSCKVEMEHKYTVQSVNILMPEVPVSGKGCGESDGQLNFAEHCHSFDQTLPGNIIKSEFTANVPCSLLFSPVLKEETVQGSFAGQDASQLSQSQATALNFKGSCGNNKGGEISNALQLNTGQTPELLMTLSSLVNNFLPDSWICQVSSHCLHLFMTSCCLDSIKTVQRSLHINISGELKILTHNRTLRKGHVIWSVIPSIPSLSEKTVQQVANNIATIICSLRRFDICIGVPEIKYENLWNQMPGCHIDENCFRETRYEKTCRSDLCSYLVPRQAKRCKFCGHLRNQLCVRLKRLLKRESDSTCIKIHPIPSESVNKHQELQKSFKDLKRINNRLSIKIASLLDRKGPGLEPFIQKELKDALKLLGK